MEATESSPEVDGILDTTITEIEPDADCPNCKKPFNVGDFYVQSRNGSIVRCVHYPQGQSL